MSSRPRKIVQASLETPTTGTIELAHDWREASPPDLALSGGVAFASLERVPDHTYGCESGYFVSPHGEIFFFLQLDQHPEIDPATDVVYLAGDFNGWQQAVGQAEWALVPASLDGASVLLWSGKAERFLTNPWLRFKFVTGQHLWLDVPVNAPNVVRDGLGNSNRLINPECTGLHLFRFTLAAPLDLSRAWRVQWTRGEGESAPLRPNGFFFNLKTELPLGVLVRADETTFRLFAPRASRVELHVCAQLTQQGAPHSYPLRQRIETRSERRAANGGTNGAEHAAAPGSWSGVWEVTLNQNLHGWFYWYTLDGPRDEFGGFDPQQRVLDPYALATVAREGPGIVLERSWVGKGDRSFRTPGWQDLIIAEAHVRDLATGMAIPATMEERRGFAGLRKWVESPDFYLHRLGVNCVELQPVTANDALTTDEYHWGYMPTSWFAPAPSYSLAPAEASGVRELQALVAALHKRGMAVLLDVVFNHVGEPAHLRFIDKLYYFELDTAGVLTNWSGCGNDVRARSAMAKRLIIDSCRYLIESYGVDGFRFDLAELLGIDVLREIETALKRVKHDVILIAEPWSFRGHIAGALADTGWASWNDGYRNFVREYVRGGGSVTQMEYYLKGSPWYFAKFPAQTVNYTESHDDRTWIDLVTEHPDGDGHNPTANDRRRTHLMAAMLFASIGIPMIAAGQDFLRTKRGVTNTYLRGDLNVLDYRRIHRFPGTHAYFADWIAFRRSDRGRLLRQWSRPSEGFFQSFSVKGSTALALLYNADRSQGPEHLLFAVNPTLQEVTLPLDAPTAGRSWRQIADHERFFPDGMHGVPQPVEAELFLAPLSCALWISWG
ncbi:MAG: glycoside hydrolase family 1 [Opitutae bacterium]|nr:glycoside hydrolase family 1 [Opitutae bacterium]